MKCTGCRGFSSGLVTLGVLLLGGMGGYNVIRTGCPLGLCGNGTCETPAEVATTVTPKTTETAQTPDNKPVEAAAKEQPEAAASR